MIDRKQDRKDVYKIIGKKQPLLFREICQRMPDYDEWRYEERRVDVALQYLRKADKVRYLYKADGGPGWVRL